MDKDALQARLGYLEAIETSIDCELDEDQIG